MLPRYNILQYQIPVLVPVPWVPVHVYTCTCVRTPIAIPVLEYMA